MLGVHTKFLEVSVAWHLQKLWISHWPSIYTLACIWAPYCLSQSGASKCLQTYKSRQRVTVLEDGVKTTLVWLLPHHVASQGSCWKGWAPEKGHLLVPRGKCTVSDQVEGLRGSLPLTHWWRDQSKEAKPGAWGPLCNSGPPALYAIIPEKPGHSQSPPPPLELGRYQRGLLATPLGWDLLIESMALLLAGGDRHGGDSLLHAALMWHKPLPHHPSSPSRFLPSSPVFCTHAHPCPQALNSSPATLPTSPLHLGSRVANSPTINNFYSFKEITEYFWVYAGRGEKHSVCRFRFDVFWI